MATILLSPQGRVSFPAVYEATIVEVGDKPKFSLVLVFDPDAMNDEQSTLLDRMVAAANEVSIAEHGVKIGERHEDGAIVKSPFRKTEEKPKYFEPGKIFVRFANKYRPNVVDGKKSPILEDTEKFYSGCWAHVSFTCYPYDYMGNKGVSFSLGNVQKTGDDEPFGGRKTSVDDDFDELEPPAAPGKTSDDIPF